MERQSSRYTRLVVTIKVDSSHLEATSMNLYLFLLKIRLDSNLTFFRDTGVAIVQKIIDRLSFYECFPTLCARNQPTGGITARGARCQNGYLENGGKQLLHSLRLTVCP